MLGLPLVADMEPCPFSQSGGDVADVAKPRGMGGGGLADVACACCAIADQKAASRGRTLEDNLPRGTEGQGG